MASGGSVTIRSFEQRGCRGVTISNRKVLVVRNDKLGDFTLALPSFDLLKRNMPDAQIVALVTGYTEPVARLSDAIDDVIIDPGMGQPGGFPIDLARRLQREQFDAAITLFSTSRVALALWLARIPARYAPATKLAQFLHNHRLVQRRSKSIKPEYEYNRDLVRSFLVDQGRLRDDELRRPVLRVDDVVASRTRQQLAEALNLPLDLRWIFLHPHSGGSAGNLSISQYAELGRLLLADRDVAIVVTAGPGEAQEAERLAKALQSRRCAAYESRDGLPRFVEVLAVADLFIGGSTGPLHLAGALDLPTAGFYPRRSTSSPLRWQTINHPDKRLAFVPPPTAHERDVGSIDVPGAAAEIKARFLS